MALSADRTGCIRSLHLQGYLVKDRKAAIYGSGSTLSTLPEGQQRAEILLCKLILR
jgi:hypothetical protein